MSLSGGILQSSYDTFFVDDAHTLGRNLESDPHSLFGDIELLGLEVGGESALGVDAGVGNVIARNHMLAGNFTNLRHDIILLIISFFDDSNCVFLSRNEVQKYNLFYYWQNVLASAIPIFDYFNKLQIDTHIQSTPYTKTKNSI